MITIAIVVLSLSSRFDHVHDDVLYAVLCVVWVIKFLRFNHLPECSIKSSLLSLQTAWTGFDPFQEVILELTLPLPLAHFFSLPGNQIITHACHLRVVNCARDRVALLTAIALDATQDERKESL